jgi:hypothetical protein
LVPTRGSQHATASNRINIIGYVPGPLPQKAKLSPALVEARKEFRVVFLEFGPNTFLLLAHYVIMREFQIMTMLGMYKEINKSVTGLSQ